MDILGVDRNYASLSTRDLLDARDQYHWHLINKQNVIGTAISLYRIRKTDDWPSDRFSAAATRNPSQPKQPRTFENSEVRDYSWPCVLVLVDTWVGADRFGTGKTNLAPEEMVPRTLYLPDGRTVPVCVVQVDRSAPDHQLLPDWTWPKTVVGGGFPLISSTQEQQHITSVGTLVTDGHTVFALTSRHVAGPAGHPVATILGGHLTDVGHSTDRQLTRLPFTDVYPDFPARRTYLTLDAALVEVTDLNQWISQTYGLPPVGELADLNERNIGMRLINAEVIAYGAASGQLRGQIAALIYRHRSIGGYDDITDFLIAPLPGQAQSQPGDSGTVWHLVQTGEKQPLRPIAVQWGGQGFLSAAGTKIYNFALAAGLTNVLRLLNVELVVDYNSGAQPFWGKTGHYSLATFACCLLTAPKLQRLMLANRDRISFAIGELTPAGIDQATKDAKTNGTFVPLADVPDVIWKNQPTKVHGGRDTSFGVGPEHPTHYADIDQPRADGKTLRALSLQDPDNVTVPFWQAFYTEFAHTKSADRGLLPFRVWQFFDAMVDALHRKDATGYVCAAGLVAHYVGDACQPLHGSVLADGFPDGRGKGVHSAYESSMIDHHATEVVAGLQTALPGTPGPAAVTDGRQAAVAVVELMDRSAKAVDPTTLVNTYLTTPGGNSKAVTAVLWRQFGDATIGILADGAVTLAMIWESAWTQGKGNTRIRAKSLTAVNETDLQAPVRGRPAPVRSLARPRCHRHNPYLATGKVLAPFVHLRGRGNSGRRDPARASALLPEARSARRPPADRRASLTSDSTFDLRRIQTGR
jgi:hypothetical protein